MSEPILVVGLGHSLGGTIWLLTHGHVSSQVNDVRGEGLLAECGKQQAGDRF